MLIPSTTCLQILRAHSCLYYYLLSLQYTLLHILFFLHTYVYVYSLVFVLHVIVLSMERT